MGAGKPGHPGRSAATGARHCPWKEPSVPLPAAGTLALPHCPGPSCAGLPAALARSGRVSTVGPTAGRGPSGGRPGVGHPLRMLTGVFLLSVLTVTVKTNDGVPAGAGCHDAVRPGGIAVGLSLSFVVDAGVTEGIVSINATMINDRGSPATRCRCRGTLEAVGRSAPARRIAIQSSRFSITKSSITKPPPMSKTASSRNRNPIAR